MNLLHPPTQVEIALGSTILLFLVPNSVRVHCGGTERVFQYLAPTTSMCPSMYESGRSHDSYRTKMRVPSRPTSIHKPCIYPSLANKPKMLGISFVFGAVRSSYRMPTSSSR